MVEKRFIYRLEALKRLKEWDENDARQKVSAAMADLSDREQEQAQAQQHCDDAQERIRALCQEDADIDPTCFQMAQAYWGQTKSDLVDSQNATSQARKGVDKAQEVLVDKSCQAKVMEKHKGRYQKNFKTTQLLNQYKTTDDLWMMRNGRGHK